MIRVLVTDDSSANRALLVALLEADAQIQVVGQAKSGAEAGAMTKRLRSQVVTMGLLDRSSSVVQHVDGLAATRTIMAESPTLNRPASLVGPRSGSTGCAPKEAV